MERKWIKTKAIFSHEIESLGIELPLEDKKEDFYFDLNNVVAFNRGSEEGFVTIWFTSDSSITIDISFEEMETIILESKKQ